MKLFKNLFSGFLVMSMVLIMPFNAFANEKNNVVTSNEITVVSDIPAPTTEK